MLSSLPQSTQNELHQLAQRYDQPLLRTVDLDANNYFDPLNKRDRYGEVCMVVRRRNGRLLTMKKAFYPAGAYRLLTGGIRHNESVLAALLRETAEETSLTVEVQRFLAIAAYRIPNISANPIFYTFAFLLDEINGTLHANDADERIEAFEEIEPGQLPQLADYLDSVTNQYSEEIAGKWSDWGRFRAAIHRLVWQALQNSSHHSLLF